MKTIKQAAEEYVLNLSEANYTETTIDKAFKAGVAFAKEWIRVEDELPNPLGESTNSEPVLVKMWDGDYYDVKQYSTVVGWFPIYDYDKVTHWRPINKK